MPYAVNEHDTARCDAPGDGWDVINKESEEVKDHHADKPDAERQVRILDDLEKDE
jgi:hypothetical protein